MKTLNGNSTWAGIIWVLVLAVLVLCGAGGFYFLKSTLDSQFVSRRCEKTIEQTVDPETLRSWATNLLVEYPPNVTNIDLDSEVPESLKRIWTRGTPHVSLKPAGASEAEHVDIVWGSGVLGHWGLLIGSPNFVAIDPRMKKRLWKAGIYFFEDLH